ncbi:MAG TPA: autotransporter outer membrane beta-barrel domain-containing protein [Stellaceae bacterium]
MHRAPPIASPVTVLAAALLSTVSAAAFAAGAAKGAEDGRPVLVLGQYLAQMPPADGGADAQDETPPSPLRRRPGAPEIEPGAGPVEPVTRPGAVPPPSAAVPREFIPIPDRWRLVDALGVVQPRVYDPYNQNVLKGDKPIFGEDWFFLSELISDTIFEPRRVPTPTNLTVPSRAGELGSFGRNGQYLLNQTFITTFSLIKGNTAYKPPELEFRLTPVFNYNRLDVGENGIVNVNPEKGRVRDDGFVGLQEGFIDYHIHNVSDRYDFDSVRVGIQPFNADFRGFLFQDAQLGVRLFGNRDNNRWQYNIAYFRRIEKDTNSGLNDITQPLRQDDIYLANIYRQDFPITGHTSQIVYIHNENKEGDDQHYDQNGFLVRPAQFGDQRGHNYSVNYLGYNGDGHFGRFNLTSSFYFAFGEDSHNMFSPDSRKSADIRAFFAALEPSVDFDWIRVRLSGLYASGDGSPTNNTESGFDAIYENPIFAGADTSYWIRQAIPFIGGGLVSLSGRNGVLPDLRSSKDEGQSNFVNPGLFLAGIGADFDVTPELRVSTNFNYLAFDKTESLQLLRNQGHVSSSIGYDLSAAITYRPFFTNNLVFRLSGAILLPGQGLKDLYNTTNGYDVFSGGKFLYSVLANVILTY